MPDPISFLPSQDGLAFTNAWPSEPAVVLPTPFGKINIGNAAAGLCGGMVFAALDFWHTGIQPPATRPAPGEPLYRYIGGAWSTRGTCRRGWPSTTSG